MSCRVTFQYYDQPFCRPKGDKLKHKPETLGEVVDGNRCGCVRALCDDRMRMNHSHALHEARAHGRCCGFPRRLRGPADIAAGCRGREPQLQQRCLPALEGHQCCCSKTSSTLPMA